jgi:ankyrin only family protein
MATIAQDEIFSHDEDGDTELHTAIILGKPDLALSLISIATSNTSLSLRNKLNQTPLYLAVILNQPEVVRRLVVGGADVTSRYSNSNTLLHIACHKGYVSVVISLITPIQRSELQQLPYKTYYQKIPQDFRICNRDGLTCLHLAASQRHFNVLELLIKYDADVNMKDGRSCRTVLHEACEKGDIKMVQFLIRSKMKCDINARTRDGKTPYDLARARGHEDICLALASVGKGAILDQEED